MKSKIQNILNKKKELENCNNLIFEKENDILSCIKSIGEEGIRMRQKNAAVSLLDLKKKKEILNNEIQDLCKGLSKSSFDKKKMSSELIANCISEGINKEDLKMLKEIFVNL